MSRFGYKKIKFAWDFVYTWMVEQRWTTDTDTTHEMNNCSCLGELVVVGRLVHRRVFGLKTYSSVNVQAKQKHKPFKDWLFIYFADSQEKVINGESFSRIKNNHFGWNVLWFLMSWKSNQRNRNKTEFALINIFIMALCCCKNKRNRQNSSELRV